MGICNVVKISELNTGYDMRNGKGMLKGFQFNTLIVRNRIEYWGLDERLIFRLILENCIVKES